MVLGHHTTGVADLSGLVGETGHLSAARAWDPSAGDPAITALDALNVLRIAVGLAPSFGNARAQHYIAADVNQDGQVTAVDALEVLRAAVGLTSTSAPRWVFFDAETDWEAADLSRHETDLIAPGMTLDSDWQGDPVQMKGILLGHLDTVV